MARVEILFVVLALFGLSHQATLEFSKDSSEMASSESMGSLSESMGSLSDEDSYDSREVECSLQHCCCHKTGFSATISAPELKHLNVHETLVFNDVTSNSKKAYNQQTGVFTAPVTDLYVFTVDATAIDGHHYVLELVSNAARDSSSDQVSDCDVIRTVHPDSRHCEKKSNFTDTASATTVLMLNKGKQVWVRLGQDGDHVVHGNYETGFSGFRV